MANLDQCGSCIPGEWPMIFSLMAHVISIIMTFYVAIAEKELKNL